jgi:hypothetical protein
MNTILQFAQAYWPVLSLGGIGAGVLAYVNRDLVLGKSGTVELPKALAGVFHGEVVAGDDEDDEDAENEELRAALKLITCHVACTIDEPAEQASALNACRTLKKHIPAPAEPPSRPPQAIENQEALLAAVAAYNTTAADKTDKITSVG